VALPPAAAAALHGLERFGVHLGLDHVRRLLAALGDPQSGLPAVLVAGTNGKGSTAALLAAAGAAAGYRTGLYTSPHLEEVEERVRIDGERIDGAALGDLVLETIAGAERSLPEPPTYFEALTAAALLHFRRREVDLAVLEVGLGGRLDATNAADSALSVIAPVSLEHREVLGETLAAIAREKAGVMRPGRATVAWAADPAVAAALAAAADAAGAELVRADREVRIESATPLPGRPWGGQRIVLATPAGRRDLTVPLLGPHQAVNAALAARAAELLAVRGWPRLDPSALTAAAARWRWPARLEAVELPPGAPCRRVLLDAAHNPAAAATLAAFLADPPAPFPALPALLFGILADKDAAAMLAALVPRAGRLVLTTPPSPRARPPESLLPLLPARPPAEVVPDPAAALDRALAAASDAGADTLVVCGSIYLVGAIRGLLRERFGVPDPA